MCLGKVGTESDWFRTQDLDANDEFRRSAFSRAVSAVRLFEVREGMEEEHTPETDLIRHHQDLEERERQRERERDRERQRETERDRERQRDTERDREQAR